LLVLDNKLEKDSYAKCAKEMASSSLESKQRDSLVSIKWKSARRMH